VHLHLFGPVGDLAERARDLLDEGRLRLVGVLGEGELPEFYANLDCVVHTEAFAGWANLVAEGMASGVPIICTPHGTLALAEHEITALVVPDPTPAILAEVIEQLRGNPRLAGRLAHNARQHIKRFSWNSYTADLLNLMNRPECGYYTWAPELGLFGKWPENQRLDGLEIILKECAAKTVCDFGSGDGLISRRIVDQGAAIVHGFEMDPGRVGLANRVCQLSNSCYFWQADLSDWPSFEIEHKERLYKSYDIVLYLGLHHHLPAATRMISLAGAAKRTSDWLALRTPAVAFDADNIESFLGNLGFTMVANKSKDDVVGLGNSYIFRRNNQVVGLDNG
jgi:2-polyprenyl-3-methyl-5-hydroxy-6-metoxy-1,4-benzoquinol methylase